jgi:predicted metalloprotease
MRLDDERESSNVEDQRGFGLPTGGLRLGGGIGTIALILIGLYFGIDPSFLLSITGNQPTSSSSVQQPSGYSSPAAGDDAQKRFVSQVLASTEDVWSDLFRRNGRTYQDPPLVLFSGATDSGCGTARAAVGPFYCPLDHKVYLDLDFFRDMQTKLGAGGDFARAYVIAHEIGHHVQSQLGIMDKVTAARERLGSAGSNALSVRVELQADCLAGIWANRANAAKQILERGDVEEGLNAADAIGDDRLQKQSRGYVVPDSFTHGTSAQRVGWFKRGLQAGDPGQCDTFSDRDL